MRRSTRPGWAGAGAVVASGPRGPRADASISRGDTTRRRCCATSVSDPTPASCYALHLRGLCALATGATQRGHRRPRTGSRADRRAPFYSACWGSATGDSGCAAEALRPGRRAGAAGARITYVPSQCYVFIYAGLGEREKALAYQERCVPGRRLAIQLPESHHPRPLRARPASPETPRADAPGVVNARISRAIPAHLLETAAPHRCTQ